MALNPYIRRNSSSQPDRELKFGLDSPLPESLAIGKGACVYLSGWCFHPTASIRKMEVTVDDKTYPVIAHSVFRQDIYRRYSMPNSSYSGFWAIVPFFEDQANSRVVVRLHVILNNGKKVGAEVAAINLCAEPLHETFKIGADHTKPDDPLVAICMATYNPPLHLFRRQIESIVSQSHQNWICIVSDDASDSESRVEIEKIVRCDRRFSFSSSPDRLGFYQNFERALSLVPENADFIVLSDQDDYWRPEKLEMLLSDFDQETTLVYSDMRIVDESGNVISDTYWTTRRNNYTNFGSLLLANTITGAASMFPRRLLSYILPFPPRVGPHYHDHWIAGVALAMGRINYIDRPLYDYVQHSTNVIGHTALLRPPIYKLVYYIFINVSSKKRRKYAQQVYFDHAVRIMFIARNTILRCGREIDKEKFKVLRRIAALDHSLTSCLWLALRGLRDWDQISVTIGAEYHLLMGVVWRIYITMMSRLGLAARYDSEG